MTVRSHDSEVLWSKIKVYTTHHRTHLVIGCREERACNAVRENLCRDIDSDSALAKDCSRRILVGILSNHAILTVLVEYGHLIGILLDFETQRLLRDLLQRVDENL